MVLWYYGITVLWYYGIMEFWNYGIMILWHYSTMALWHYGIMALWHYGTMALWYQGVSCTLPFKPLGNCNVRKLISLIAASCWNTHAYPRKNSMGWNVRKAHVLLPEGPRSPRCLGGNCGEPCFSFVRPWTSEIDAFWLTFSRRLYPSRNSSTGLVQRRHLKAFRPGPGAEFSIAVVVIVA